MVILFVDAKKLDEEPLSLNLVYNHCTFGINHNGFN